MSEKNCPNCGAPYDYKYDKCPYCGTYYLDLTGIDFYDRKPIFIKMRTTTWNNGKSVPVTFTQKAIPEIGNIEVTADDYDIYDGRGNVIMRRTASRQCITNVSFRSIPMEDGALFYMHVPENE